MRRSGINCTSHRGLRYCGPSPYLNIHTARAVVSEASPNFDGLSGFPVFAIEDKMLVSTRANFAGMLIRATRSSSLMHFISGECIGSYIYAFFVQGLHQQKASEKMAVLFAKHYFGE
jgi:hypothetical protein